eukprot:4657619-Lingulodinium_polyedra.AAC.1
MSTMLTMRMNEEGWAVLVHENTETAVKDLLQHAIFKNSAGDIYIGDKVNNSVSWQSELLKQH